MGTPLITSEITPGQKEQVIRVATDAFRKGLDDLEKAGRITKAGLQRVLANGGRLSSVLAITAKEKIAELGHGRIGCLQCISLDQVISLDPTDSMETIRESTGVFQRIGLGFQMLSRVSHGIQSERIEAQVFELKEDRNSKEIFGTFGENLDRLCFTQGQIVQFCKEHSTWLQKDTTTFFLFKVWDEYFLVNVVRLEDGLYVSLSRFDVYSIWFHEFGFQVVVPAL